jgi:fatty acid amide hydrolase
VHAFTEVLGESALAEAARADDERAKGRARGPLHGLPVSVKECFDVGGKATTLGLASWRDRVAKEDSALVRALREAGAVVLGRTNLSQTMLFVESRNPLFGQTANPFELAHTPGGSSGGEAAAVASGMSPLGVGTDIGGSVRVPCHFSGVAGLKPTLDRLPTRGQRTVLAGQEIVRSQSGPLSRTVAGLVLLLRALDPRALSSLDPRVPPVPIEDPARIELPGLRVGMYTDDGVLPASRAIVRAVERTAAALRGRGCEVVPFELRADELMDDYLAALSADGGQLVLEALEGGEVDPSLAPLKQLARLPGRARRALAGGARALGQGRLSRMLRAMGEKPVAEVWRLTARLRARRLEILDRMAAAGLDALICPPFATPALPHGLSKNFALAGSFSMVWNAMDLPAGVVPVTRVREDETTRAASRDRMERQAAEVDRASAGLPVGVQVVARPWAEAAVLALMQAIEDAVRSSPDFPTTPVDPKR